MGFTIMNLPQVIFSNWTKWMERTKISNIKKPGVYVLAHFVKPPSTVDLQAKEIIYVGETHGQTLRDRWGQFHRCAFKGKKGHSGGRTYWSLFNGGKIEQLYVAGFPVDSLSGDSCPVFIQYLERKLILEYVVKWDRRPKCNLE